jgi:hypothetical protein
MRRFKLALGVMTAVLLVAGLSAAQNKKDFNGKWAPDAEKNGPAPARGGASGFTITMDAKTLNIETVRGTATSKDSYKLDGTESKNVAARAGGAPDVISVAKWDGDAVVIVTKGANGDTTTKYYLEGADLVREVTRPAAGGAAPTPTKQYFKKTM